MSTFNRGRIRPAVSSPVRAEHSPSTVTHEGGPGHERDPRSELFLLAVSNMVNQDAFYERGGERDDRYSQLVRHLAVEDPEWTAAFLAWLRNGANMRSAAIVGAAEYVKARLDAAGTRERRNHETSTDATRSSLGETFGGDSLAYRVTTNRRVIDSVLQRADEPGELLAYWTARYGRNEPKPVKRGVADAVLRLYTEKSLIKWDSDGATYRFGDVIERVHPTGVHPSVKGTPLGDLFEYAIDQRHGRGNPIPETLITVGNRAELLSWPREERRALFDRSQAVYVLKDAGMTWEQVSAWLPGGMNAKVWEALIPSMGYMALLRNLRNFDQAGVSDVVAEQVAARLADPEQVAKSMQFPFRFYAAYTATRSSLRWGHALEKALRASLENVPTLPGRTLVLVDQSPSMFPGYGSSTPSDSDITNADKAKLFGAAVALRAASADLIGYGNTSYRVPFNRADAVLRVMEKFQMNDGTDTLQTLADHFDGHDRVLIVTDEQTRRNARYPSVDTIVPGNVPVYTWNIAGYKLGHSGAGHGHRHTFGGFTDHAFRMIPLLEAGRSANWELIFGEEGDHAS